MSEKKVKNFTDYYTDNSLLFEKNDNNYNIFLEINKSSNVERVNIEDKIYK